MMPVYTIVPVNGTRRTATLWRVGRLSADGEFAPASDSMSLEKAQARERELRREAYASRKDADHPPKKGDTNAK